MGLLKSTQIKLWINHNAVEFSGDLKKKKIKRESSAKMRKHCALLVWLYVASAETIACKSHLH